MQMKLVSGQANLSPWVCSPPSAAAASMGLPGLCWQGRSVPPLQALWPPLVPAILCCPSHQELASHSYPTRFTKVLSRVSTMMLSPALTKGGTRMMVPPVTVAGLYCGDTRSP